VSRTTGPRRRVRRGTAVLGAALTAVLFLLTGCARIPTSGPVLEGRSSGATPRAYVRIFGVPPQPGASPEGIIRGFLRAAADISDDRRVAREYLAEDIRSRWRSDTSTVVFSADSALRLATDGGPGGASPLSGTATPDGSTAPSGTATPEGSTIPSGTAAAAAEGSRVGVRLIAPVVARLDAAGHYRAAGSADREVREFGLVVENGQWRIDEVPDGVLISRADFEDTYWDLSVYFADPTGGWLVPDVRWMPVSSSTATTLVRAVLNGPPDWLAPAVTTGAPTGTGMTQPSVPVKDGVATVDLTRQALQADPMRRQMLKAQLTQSLSRIPAVAQTRIERVEITVESSRYDITSGPAASATEGRPAEPGARLITEPVVDNWPVVLTGNRLVRTGIGDPTQVPHQDGLAVPGAAWPAAAPDSSGYAVLQGQRLLHSDAGGQTTVLLDGKGALVPPSFDPFSWVWTAQAEPGGAVLVARPGQAPSRLAVTQWPDDFTVTAVRVSRDGTRVLISGVGGGQARLFICAVERHDGRIPVRLGPPLSLLPDLRSAGSAAWSDQRHVVVLGRLGNGPEQVWEVEVGGTARVLPVVAGARNVTAGNGDIYLGTNDGVVYRWGQTSWQWFSTGDWPAMPG
jgi:hypothetical protein